MSIPAIKDFNDYNKYANEADFTTEAQAQEFQGNQNDILRALVGSYLWQPSTAYEVGRRLRTPSMSAGMEAVCVTAGTSSNVEPEWGTAAGEKIADGTAFWQLIPLTITVDGIVQDAQGNITLPVMTGATTEAAGTAGKVPAPSAGAENKALCGDGTYKNLQEIAGLLSLEQGGTGADTAAAARSNLGLNTAVTNASVSGTTITLNKADGDKISLTMQAAPQSSVTVTASTQAALSASMTGGATSCSIKATIPNTVKGISAGTYTLQNLLQNLVNKSHTHTSSSFTASSWCDCYSSDG